MGDGTFEVRSPIDTDDPRRDVREGHPQGRPGRDRGRPPRPARVVPARLGGAPRDPQARRRADQRAPDGVLGPDGGRGGQDPARGAGRGGGGGRPHPLLREDGRGQRVLRPPDGQPGRPRGPHPVDPAPARRVRGHQPVQLPDGARRRAVGRGDDGRQHRRVQAGLGVGDDRGRDRARSYRDAGVPDGVFNLVMGPGDTVGDELQKNPGIDGIVFTGSYEVGFELFRNVLDALPAAVHRRDGRQEPGDRPAQRRPRGGGRGDHALGVRVRRPEVLGQQPGLRRAPVHDELVRLPGREDRAAGRRRPAPADRVPRPGHRRARGRSATSRRSPRRAATARCSPAASTSPTATLARGYYVEPTVAGGAGEPSPVPGRAVRAVHGGRRGGLARRGAHPRQRQRLRPDRGRVLGGPGRDRAVPRGDPRGRPVRQPARRRDDRRLAGRPGVRRLEGLRARPGSRACRCTTSGRFLREQSHTSSTDRCACAVRGGLVLALVAQVLAGCSLRAHAAARCPSSSSRSG